MPWTREASMRYRTLRRAMPQPAAFLYGVVDAAVHDTLHDDLKGEPVDSQVRCLFDGAPGIRYARVAPYLLHIHEHSPLVQRWLEEDWGSPLGLFIASALAPEPCKRHLKKLLHVDLPSGQQALFRFYDPRVMERMMPALQPGQHGNLFGLDGAARLDAVMLGRPDGRLVRYMPGIQDLGMRFAQACRLKTDVFEVTPH